MKRTLHVCPLTGERYRAPEQPWTGLPEAVDPEADDPGDPGAMPPGWGALRLYVRVANPAFVIAQQVREQARLGVEAELTATIEDAQEEGGTLDEGAIARTRAALLEELDTTYPLPAFEITLVYAVTDLSPRAMAQIAMALQSAGLRLADPNGAVAVEAAPSPPVEAVAPAPALPPPRSTPATGVVIPEAAPAPAPPRSTPATGVVIPEPPPPVGGSAP